ncbi:Nudix hydrolase family protein [[Actinomadura] parvosata subsp. kistnae]|uniref:NUDIX hydrolase n=1 Tax=[Actinomadura] parvosata subsp. kistnae TaxID=1909395 RepID=A0A1V0AFB0_9ACTN|nr:NUDIX domain-containing protein [Nonomuraea sp. ATCC 55076]AQZ68898.1 NUDIX hydrolase [Nonomuraea sp. ATCC 55076]SPL92562.1 Nudix hydrolase family protein [Actinomadura parvosata subsp. kistnae]
MRWQVHSEKSVYLDPWLDVRIADVELPDGRHIDHRLIRTAPGAGAVVTDADDRVLLIWRHRFITDSWGWEIPLGQVDDGEPPIAAAAREVEEETGWRPGPLRPLLAVQPGNGFSDGLNHVYRADSAVHVGPPAHPWEAERVEWVPFATVRKLVATGDIVCGTSISALLHTLVESLPEAVPPQGPELSFLYDYDPGRVYPLPGNLPDLL